MFDLILHDLMFQKRGKPRQKQLYDEKDVKNYNKSPLKVSCSRRKSTGWPKILLTIKLAKKHL